ncbi:hypothetical protein BDK92_6449 [Micromonospora pisi]|uniref:WD40 repeat protein n=1 Tax=Micromonospora pisi TaxID=589240 RepID=A0A495JSP2_9ACTN|nr:WD40 repeat domain-containing protein [Micromonospora pisi]RKR92017.1 hypothetical protein BDK92_6449 [Micromonospora pisi]
MTSEPDRRITAGLRQVADALPVTPPPVGQLRARAFHRASTGRAAWRRPAFAAAAVLAVLVVVALLPVPGTGGRGWDPASPAVSPTLPHRFAGMSLLTASVSTAPPGPAMALYGQGSLGTRLGTSQVLVLGVDGRTYRRLDLAEQRGATGDDGEWHAAGVLLAPDGTRVAVASEQRVDDGLELVDLRTGAVRRIPLGRPVTVRLLAWTPDGSRLVISMGDGALDGSGSRNGRLAVVDLGNGRVSMVGQELLPDPYLKVAVSPDGELLAVPTGPGRVALVDLTGVVRRSLTLPEGYYLDSPAAWSPDGRLLAVQHLGAVRGGLAFVDVTGVGAPTPAPLSALAHPAALLGWASERAVLVGVEGGDYEIVERSVDGAVTRTVARAGQGPGRIGRVDGLQLAKGLLEDLRVAEVGGPDRGPWPRWWIVSVAALVLGGCWLIRPLRRRVTRMLAGSAAPVDRPAAHDPDRE